MDRREFLGSVAVGAGALALGVEAVAASKPTSLHMVPIHDHPDLVWCLENYGTDVALRPMDVPEHNLHMVFLSEGRSLRYRLFLNTVPFRVDPDQEVPHLYLGKNNKFTSYGTNVEGVEVNYALEIITAAEYQRRFNKFHG